MAGVVWVGLSAKIGATTPLHHETVSGGILSRVEARCPRAKFYRANLVRCAPVGEDGRLREPSQREIEACRPLLAADLELIQPRLVVALGGSVGQALGGPSLPPVGPELWPTYEPQAVGGVVVAVVHHPAFVRRRWCSRLAQYEEALALLAVGLGAAGAAPGP